MLEHERREKQKTEQQEKHSSAKVNYLKAEKRLKEFTKNFPGIIYLLASRLSKRELETTATKSGKHQYKVLNLI